MLFNKLTLEIELPPSDRLSCNIEYCKENQMT